VWEEGALYRAVGGRELRIAPAHGGVEVDAETEPVVRKLLGFDFDLVSFAAWAAGEEKLAPFVVHFAGFRPSLAPDPFEALVTSIAAQQVSLFAAVAIRNRLVEPSANASAGRGRFPDGSELPRHRRRSSCLSASRGANRITWSASRAQTSTSPHSRCFQTRKSRNG
jgi:3-methyladenine DNA glycosylase/8-oxoguanine DNA glycosylase